MIKVSQANEIESCIGFVSACCCYNILFVSCAFLAKLRLKEAVLAMWKREQTKTCNVLRGIVYFNMPRT